MKNARTTVAFSLLTSVWAAQPTPRLRLGKPIELVVRKSFELDEVGLECATGPEEADTDLGQGVTRIFLQGELEVLQRGVEVRWRQFVPMEAAFEVGLVSFGVDPAGTGQPRFLFRCHRDLYLPGAMACATSLDLIDPFDELCPTLS